VVIRENTEGPYAGEGGVPAQGHAHEVATQGSVNTRMGVERCVRYAFELAASRPAAPHARAQDQRADLRRRPVAAGVRRGGAEFPEVATAYNHVDAACIYFVQDPQRYDVIVTDNLFGDILTDLGGAVSGGIGLASSANLNPARTGPSMFEPVHGSAPDIAGTEHGQPDGRDPLGRHDARLPRRGRRRRPHPQGVRRAVTGSTTDDRRRHRRPRGN
jgi:3-isopropylmalate dehydrogenase